jgi:predicted RNase H-like nuclease
MYFVGVDLAWAGRNPTGIAVLDAAGRLVHLGAVRDDAAVLAALAPYVGGACVVAFDAPLVVTNRTGQRPAEAALNRDFRRFEAGAHPCNTTKPEFADGPRAGRLAGALRLDLDPRSAAARRAIEVYPHAATVVLFRLARTLKYKAKSGRSLEQLRAELLLLMDGIERLEDTDPPLLLGGRDGYGHDGNGGWAELRGRTVAAQRKSELRRVEDPVDAVVCAYVALYAHRHPGRITLYGDLETGYIVTPALPAELRPG